MKELGFIQALELSAKIRTVLGCEVPLPVALKEEATKKPRPDVASTVMCKIKVVRGQGDYHCAVVNGSSCPLNFPVEEVK